MAQQQPAKAGDIIEKLASPHKSTITDGARLVVIDVSSGDDSAVVIDGNGNIETLWYPDQYKVVGNTEEKLKEMYENVYKSKPVTEEQVADFHKEHFNVDLKSSKKNTPE